MQEKKAGFGLNKESAPHLKSIEKFFWLSLIQKPFLQFNVTDSEYKYKELFIGGWLQVRNPLWKKDTVKLQTFSKTKIIKSKIDKNTNLKRLAYFSYKPNSNLINATKLEVISLLIYD